MSNNVSEGETSYRGTTLPDSGAKISQDIKQADRDQKFKFFECIQALMKGRLPTNEQLDQFLAMSQSSTSLEPRAHMLSKDGQALYKDFQQLIQNTREIIAEKNQEELFQNFIHHCTLATDTVPDAVDPRAPIGIGQKVVSSNKAQKEARQILQNMKSVAKLVTTNSEFRSILDEMFQLAMEVLRDSADKVAQGAQKMSEKASQKATQISNTAASTADALSQDGEINQEIQRAGDRAQDLALNAKEDPHDTAHETRQELRQGTDSLKDYAKQQTAEMRQQFNLRDKDTKARFQAKTSEMHGNAIEYAIQKMPKERRQAIIERLKLIVGQIQSDPQYQTTVDSVIDLIGTWRQRAQGPAGSASTETGKIARDPNVEAATIEFKTILERWAQGYSLDPMIELVKNMWESARQDPQLSQYFDSVSFFISRAVREPYYVTSDAIDRDTELLLDQGQTLLKVKYRLDTDALMSEAHNFLEKLSTDPMVRQVADNFQKVAKNMFYNKKGKLTFKPHLFDDFRYVLLPSLFDAFQFIPIPRIEYSDLKVDLMFDNMILTSKDLIPRLFEIQMNNSIRMVPRGKPNKSSDTNKHEFIMFIQGVEANVRHVDYYVKTKEGFRFKDRGIADVLINRRGFDIRVEGQKTQHDEDDYTPSLITFDKVQVKIHALTVKMRKSQHPVMNAFVQPFIKTAVKNAIAHAIEAELKEALISGDRAAATAVRDTRIKTGKNTFGALLETAASLVQNKFSSDDKSKSSKSRRKNSGNYNRTSRVIFDADGLCVLDPVKHIELKVGQPLIEDKNAMANMNVDAPWASPAFDLHGLQTNIEAKKRNELPGMRRTHGTLAIGNPEVYGGNNDDSYDSATDNNN
ncbi:hypothetical protein BGX26_000762 [Mortierella sp. AD094]|nr:hypothetical protein BGX26_000762 [Mortierella sp. AD094]